MLLVFSVRRHLAANDDSIQDLKQAFKTVSKQSLTIVLLSTPSNTSFQRYLNLNFAESINYKCIHPEMTL